MKKILTLFIFLLASSISHAQQIISHSTSQIVESGAVACVDGTPSTYTRENNYFRTYTLSNFGISGTQQLTGGQFGVVFVDGNGGNSSLQVRVQVFKSAGVFPNGNLTSIAERSITINEDDNFTVKNFRFSAAAAIEATDILVIELSFERGEAELVRARVGQNDKGETSPSYFSAPLCGQADPITFASTGFPGNAIINLTINGTLEVAENNLESISIFPNPSKDIINLKNPSNVEIQEIVLFNQLGQRVLAEIQNNSIPIQHLKSGVYFLQINTDRGTLNKKIIKN